MSHTLHLATDGSVTSDRYTSTGAAAFIALEDKMGFYDTAVKLPSTHDDIYAYDTQSFIPELRACMHALNYAKYRAEDGPYNKIVMYTDNLAALCLSSHIIEHGPIDLNPKNAQKSVNELMSTDRNVTAFKTNTQTESMKSSPLRYVFDPKRASRGVRRDVAAINAVAANLPENIVFKFEHIRSHQQDNPSFTRDSYKKFKARLNALADDVVTDVNSANRLDGKYRKHIVDKMDKEFNSILENPKYKTPWNNAIDANLARTTTDKNELNIVGNAQFIKDYLEDQEPDF